MRYELRFLCSNGARFTCIAYPTKTKTVYENIFSCINEILKDKDVILSSIAPTNKGQKFEEEGYNEEEDI